MPQALKIKKLYKDTEIPIRQTPTDSGFDLFAHNFKQIWTGGMMEHCVKADKDSQQFSGFTDRDGGLMLNPGERVLIGTGIAATVGPGYEIQIRSRSGVALKAGCVVLNSPGTVDCDFRGEIGVILANLSQKTRTIDLKERIAQMVVCPVELPYIQIVDELEDTNRGDGGFGSTGT